MIDLYKVSLFFHILRQKLLLGAFLILVLFTIFLLYFILTSFLLYFVFTKLLIWASFSFLMCILVNNSIYFL